MKKFALLAAIMVLVAALMTGCNSTARNWGGTQTVKLEHGQKLVNMTWKDSDLWILTREMRPDEKPESYRFQEDSNYGILEGHVNVIESK